MRHFLPISRLVVALDKAEQGGCLLVRKSIIQWQIEGSTPIRDIFSRSGMIVLKAALKSKQHPDIRARRIKVVQSKMQAKVNLLCMRTAVDQDGEL